MDVPAPVVPYMPPATHRDQRRRVQVVQMPEPGVQVVNKKSSPATPASADFDSFEAAPAKKSGDMTPVPEFHETDRIDQQNVLLQVSYPNSRRKKNRGNASLPDTYSLFGLCSYNHFSREFVVRSGT